MPPIHWPAILQFAGHSEILYLTDAADLASHRGLKVHPQDRLIDSEGTCYTLDASLEVSPSGHAPISLQVLIDILQQHMASIESVCATKLAAHSMAEAIRLAGTLPNTR